MSARPGRRGSGARRAAQAVGRSGLHPRASLHARSRDAALPRARPAGPLPRPAPAVQLATQRPSSETEPWVPAVFQAPERVSPDLRPRPCSLTDRTPSRTPSQPRQLCPRPERPPEAASLGHLPCASAWHASSTGPRPRAPSGQCPLLRSQRGPCPARPDGVLSLGYGRGSALLTRGLLPGPLPNLIFAECARPGKWGHLSAETENSFRSVPHSFPSVGSAHTSD